MSPGPVWPVMIKGHRSVASLEGKLRSSLGPREHGCEKSSVGGEGRGLFPTMGMLREDCDIAGV